MQGTGNSAMSTGVLVGRQRDISLDSCFASPYWFVNGCERGAGVPWMERFWVSLYIALLFASIFCQATRLAIVAVLSEDLGNSVRNLS